MKKPYTLPWFTLFVICTHTVWSLLRLSACRCAKIIRSTFTTSTKGRKLVCHYRWTLLNAGWQITTKHNSKDCLGGNLWKQHKYVFHIHLLERRGHQLKIIRNRTEEFNISCFCNATKKKISKRKLCFYFLTRLLTRLETHVCNCSSCVMTSE